MSVPEDRYNRAQQASYAMADQFSDLAAEAFRLGDEFGQLKIIALAACKNVGVPANDGWNGIGRLSEQVFTQRVVVDATLDMEFPPSKIIENTIFVIDGPRRKFNLMIRTNDVTLRRCVIYAPHEATYYFDGYATKEECIGLFIDKDVTNVNIESCQFFGCTHGIYAYKARGTNVKKCFFGRQYRHCVLIHGDDGQSYRPTTISDCYGHGHVNQQLRAGGSTDGFNLYSCAEHKDFTKGARHTIRSCVYEGGFGEHGSAFIIDGQDEVGTHGGCQIINSVGIDAGNKVAAIAGGRNNLIDSVLGYQGKASPRRFYSSGGRPFYCHDHRSGSNGRSKDFSNNVIKNCRSYWFVETDRVVGALTAHPAVTTLKSYAYDWPAEAAQYINNTFVDETLTREGVRAVAVGLLQGVEWFQTNYESETGFIEFYEE